MATKHEDGKDFGPGDYAYVPDAAKPSTWKLRLTASPGASPDSGIVGAAAAALGPGGFRGNPVEIPAADRAKVVGRVRAAWRKANPGKQDDEMPESIRPSGSANHAATFGADAPVLRTGKIFEAGDAESKQFWMTPDELREAVANFAPVPIDSGHPLNASPLDGKMGMVNAIRVGENGWDLEADVAWPQWLDDLVPADERKVSAKWDRETKRLLALSLVSEPHFDDAALYAAFAKRHDTHEGQATIQGLHDMAARSGAVCKQANATMGSAHEMAGVQAIHDTAVLHGAQCNAIGTAKPYALYSAEPVAMRPKRGGNPMSWLADLFRVAKDAPEGFDPDAMFSVAAPVRPAATPTAAAPGPVAPVAVDTEKDTLRAQLREERAKNITLAAATFAKEYIEHQEKAMVSEREAIISAYTQAAEDDMNYPGTVTFANGTQTTRVAKLTATYEARQKAHELTGERLKSALFALENLQTTANPNDPNRKPTREEKDALLAMTPLGQTHLRERARNGSN